MPEVLQLRDEDIVTTWPTPDLAGRAALSDPDATDGGDADGTDGADADGTDGADADGTDGADADGADS
jgi:hypothetical protein